MDVVLATSGSGLIRKTYEVKSHQLGGEQSSLSFTLRFVPFIRDMSLHCIQNSDHIKWYDCDNADTIVNSSSFLRF